MYNLTKQFALSSGQVHEKLETFMDLVHNLASVLQAALNSSMLYGNQFDMETFMKMFD